MKKEKIRYAVIFFIVALITASLLILFSCCPFIDLLYDYELDESLVVAKEKVDRYQAQPKRSFYMGFTPF